MRELIIDGTVINDDNDCYVIAEIGHNHQGSVETAMEMFQAAKYCGVNAVKLQKRDNRSLFTTKKFNQPYANQNSYGATYGEHRMALELGRDEYTTLKKFAAELGLMMFATAFDIPSVDFLEEIDLSAYKVASGDLKSTPLLKYIAETGKPIIISTGGASLEDVQRACDTVMPINEQLAILQCTANYPTWAENMNLRVITTYRGLFPNNVIGLSDHQSGIAMAVVAYTLGARIVEKHFTLNRAWKGTDHAFSLEPIGLRKLMRDLQRARHAFGDGIKRPLEIEEEAVKKMGKKLVAARDLPAGSKLSIDDIAIKSPGDGLPPYELENVISKVLIQPLKEDDDITFDLLDGR